MIQNMFSNIEEFLNLKEKKIKKLSNNWQKPIILEWQSDNLMNNCLKIIDKKVLYLFKNQAISKLEQWFLGDDQNFNSITAERYIIDYLRSKNEDIEDNLTKYGIDAVYTLNNKKIGIEITTLNKFIAEWIFIERLQMYLKGKQLVNPYTLEIGYDYERITEEMKKNNIYNYIQKVGENIISNNSKNLNSLQIQCTKTNRQTGYITGDYNQSNEFTLIKYLTKGLVKKLNDKKKQLSKFSQNLIFVGINHSRLNNWITARIFEEIGNSGISHKSEIQQIQNYLSKELPSNIIGVCYFFYSLPQEQPKYPLKIFWKDNENQIEINL